MIRASAQFLLVSALLGACASQPKLDPVSQPSAESDNPSATELLRLGREAARRGDAVRAEQYLALAIEQGGDARVVMPILLRACIKSSHLRTALNHAEPYLLANPEDDELRKLVATIHLGLGQTADARRELGLLLQRDENNPDAHYLLGVIASDHELPSARLHLQLAIEHTRSEEQRIEIRSRLAELELREREVKARRGAPVEADAGDGS